MTKIRGVYYRGSVAHIRYQNERGEIVRESTGQSNAKVAQQILEKKRSEVAMGQHFRTRQFEKITFGELLELWWQRHGKNTRSRFHYHLPSIRERFAKSRARSLRPE